MSAAARRLAEDGPLLEAEIRERGEGPAEVVVLPRGRQLREFTAAALKRHYGDSRSGVKQCANDAGATPRCAQMWFAGETAPSTEHFFALARHIDELAVAAAAWTAMRHDGRWDLAHQLYLRVIALGPGAIALFDRLAALDGERQAVLGQLLDVTERR